MATSGFDALTEVYEAMIDWPRRLAHEGPFYRRWFDRAGVSRVVDVACGAGHHAAMFHQWGLEVEAADLNAGMIERARQNFLVADGIRWTVRGFDQPLDPPAAFDAAVCVGNSLALAGDRDVVGRVLAAMLAAVRPGGLAIVHVLNLWRLPDGPCLWQKCRRTMLTLGDVLILKGVHRSGRRGFVELTVLRPEGGAPVLSESPEFLGIEAVDLEGMARRAGAREVACFGGYQNEPYEREKSTDLILVATR